MSYSKKFISWKGWFLFITGRLTYIMQKTNLEDPYNCNFYIQRRYYTSTARVNPALYLLDKQLLKL